MRNLLGMLTEYADAARGSVTVQLGRARRKARRGTRAVADLARWLFVDRSARPARVGRTSVLLAVGALLPVVLALGALWLVGPLSDGSEEPIGDSPREVAGDFPSHREQPADRSGVTTTEQPATESEQEDPSDADSADGDAQDAPATTGATGESDGSSGTTSPAASGAGQPAPAGIPGASTTGGAGGSTEVSTSPSTASGGGGAPATPSPTTAPATTSPTTAPDATTTTAPGEDPPPDGSGNTGLVGGLLGGVLGLLGLSTG